MYKLHHCITTTFCWFRKIYRCKTTRYLMIAFIKLYASQRNQGGMSWYVIKACHAHTVVHTSTVIYRGNSSLGKAFCYGNASYISHTSFIMQVRGYYQNTHIRSFNFRVFQAWLGFAKYENVLPRDMLLSAIVKYIFVFIDFHTYSVFNMAIAKLDNGVKRWIAYQKAHCFEMWHCFVYHPIVQCISY